MHGYGATSGVILVEMLGGYLTVSGKTIGGYGADVPVTELIDRRRVFAQVKLGADKDHWRRWRVVPQLGPPLRNMDQQWRCTPWRRAAHLASDVFVTGWAD